MTENERYLKEAYKCIKGFEIEREPEQLREAYMALENIIWVHEGDPKVRLQLRKNSLSLWLHLLEFLNRFLDPNFNPEDVPEKLVQPPLISGDVVLRPGADPALIDDPKVRAEYEKAIAANRTKIDHYRLQVGLNRLNERIPPRAEAFIRDSYTSAPGDQAELRTAIDMIIKDRQRKKDLLKLLASPSP